MVVWAGYACSLALVSKKIITLAPSRPWAIILMEALPIELIPHFQTKLPKSYKNGEVSLAQNWAIRVTSSTLIGWLGHDSEDKIRFLSYHGFLPRLVANGDWNPHHNYCSSSQIPEFRAPLVWKRYAILMTGLFRQAFILLGLSWL